MGNNLEAKTPSWPRNMEQYSPPVDVLDILTTNIEDEQKIGAFFASKPNLLNEFVDSFSPSLKFINLIFYLATCRCT